jgi:hypothetical protein
MKYRYTEIAVIYFKFIDVKFFSQHLSLETIKF